MALSDFSKTFGLQDVKGFFPHHFNLPENQSYIGEYPDKKFYGSDYFSSKKKAEFDSWYESVKNEVFDFQEQFLTYCWGDVKLLSEGCLAFRKILLEKTGVDPFRTTITIASLCHYIFRKKFLKPESIGIIPDNGYHPEDKASVKSLMWLKYLSESNNIQIRHSKNFGEVRVGNYKIDGYSEEINTYFEFHGCVYHGCPKCFKPETFNKFKQQTMRTTFSDHCKRIDFIRENIN